MVWYPSGKVMVVTSGDMFTETSGDHQYCLITFWTLPNENAGDVIVSFPLAWFMVAKDGMMTSAEELSALTTVTCRLRLSSRAVLSSLAGFAILANTAICSVKESYIREMYLGIAVCIEGDGKRFCRECLYRHNRTGKEEHASDNEI